MDNFQIVGLFVLDNFFYLFTGRHIYKPFTYTNYNLKKRNNFIYNNVTYNKYLELNNRRKIY